MDAPALATCRRAGDGADVDLDEPARHDRLEAALEAGADMVDVERDAPFREELARKARGADARVIVSEHDLDATPTPQEILDTLGELGPHGDVAKLATRAPDRESVDRLVEAALQAPELGTPFALMGVGDSLLRGLAGPLGQALVYATEDEPAAAGQLPAEIQARLPRSPPSPSPQEDYVLLGHPVEHSLSPPMQEAAFRHLDRPARYRLLDVAPQDLGTVIEGLRVSTAGGNTTAPHKIDVHDAADERTDEARRVGAANTMRFEDGEVHVHMTDGLGARDALESHGVALDGRRVLVLGAGGTARAVGHALAEAGAELTIANRTRERADELAAELGAESLPLEEAALGKALDPGALAFNATPVDPPVPDEALERAVAFDANYGHRAAFAQRARLAGADTLDGLDLLVAQGVRSLSFWLDEDVDEATAARMRTAARTRALERRYGRHSR